MAAPKNYSKINTKRNYTNLQQSDKIYCVISLSNPGPCQSLDKLQDKLSKFPFFEKKKEKRKAKLKERERKKNCRNFSQDGDREIYSIDL